MNRLARLRPVPLAIGLALWAVAGATVTADDASATTAGGDPLLEEGRDLYLTGCASCHGADGAGVRIVEPGDGLSDEVTGPADGPGQLRGPSLLGSGEAAAYYYLSTGRMPLANADDQPRRKDPAYGPEQIAALVAYVGSLGDGPPLSDVDTDDADLAHGGEVYRLNCQACHSAFGSGGALSYGRAAPALHSAEPLEVGAAVRAGPGQMPVFGRDTISDDDLDDLAAYVAYLGDPENVGGLQIGRNGPVPEGFVIWIFGIGGLLLIVAWIGGRSPISHRESDEDVS